MSDLPIRDINSVTGERTTVDDDLIPPMTDSEKIDLILEKMIRTEAMVGKIIGEVKPTIDELMNSQLFKMLGMKKK